MTLSPEIYPLNPITIESIRDFISENVLPSTYTILLNQDNFDDLVLEYRDIYREPLVTPYDILGITIDVDTTNTVYRRTIGIIK